MISQLLPVTSMFASTEMFMCILIRVLLYFNQQKLKQTTTAAVKQTTTTEV